MNFNEAAFAQPRIFRPERWLNQDASTLSRLDDSWAPFSKGSRGCLGKNLAMAEIYILLACVIRRFKLARIVQNDMNIREVFGVIFDLPLKFELAEAPE